MFDLAVTYVEAGFAVLSFLLGYLLLYGLLKGGGMKSSKFVISLTGSVAVGVITNYYDSTVGSDAFSFFLIGLFAGIAIYSFLYISISSGRKSYEEMTGRRPRYRLIFRRTIRKPFKPLTIVDWRT